MNILAHLFTRPKILTKEDLELYIIKALTEDHNIFVLPSDSLEKDVTLLFLCEFIEELQDSLGICIPDSVDFDVKMSWSEVVSIIWSECYD